jgi:8-oxo-dGTP pyrophosphatase MutT (NUDIX family)
MVERGENIGFSVAVRAILLDKKGRVLLGLRARGIGAGQWALIGGKPDKKGESLESAVIRETQEEVGISFQPKRYREIIGPDGVTQDRWLTAYFWDQTGQTNINLNRDEIKAADFFTLKEVFNLDVAFDHLEVICEFFANFSTIREGQQFPPLKLATGQP